MTSRPPIIVLAGNLEGVDERRASTIWWKLNHVARVFRLKEVVPLLTGYLPKGGPSVQLDILQTLKTLQAVEFVPQIVPLLQSPEEYIRREALDTLVSLRAKEAAPSLVALLRDKDALKRYYALTSLVKVKGREAAPAIARVLEDENEDNRYWALDALVKLDAHGYADVEAYRRGSAPPNGGVCAGRFNLFRRAARDPPSRQEGDRGRLDPPH